MESRGWRLRTCSPQDLWDVGQVSILKGSTLLKPQSAVSSGSASDPDKGNVPGYGAENSIMRSDGGSWGGRPDKQGEMYIGALFSEPQLPDCFFITQQNDVHFTDCAHLERLNGSDWEVVTSAFELEGAQESIICAPWVPKHSKHARTATQAEEEKRNLELQALQADSQSDTTVVLYSDKGCKGERFVLVQDFTRLCGALKFPVSKKQITVGTTALSMQVLGKGEVDLFSDCEGKQYWSSVMPLDGCTNLYSWPSTASFRVNHVSSLDAQIEPSVAWNVGQTMQTGSPEKAQKKYRVVFSAESSEYHGFQTQASLYSFMESRQGEAGGMWTRLLTASQPDDVMDTFPTFYAKRHPYSLRYSPLNKADTTAKWYASVNAPGPNEVIVMIDPDNWLLKPIDKHVAEVTPGNAVAEAAWFSGQGRLVRQLWMEFCRGENCADARLDLAAVPYFVHSQDLARIAPLWKEYVLIMREELEKNKQMSTKYRSLQIDWCIEMYGYVFAAAELGIKHTIKRRLQIRDVDGLPSEQEKSTILMLHTGRAWFPKDYAPAARWHHTEGAAWAYRGKQVWCKCNYTAARVVPWPVPAEADWISYHTLRILHDAQEFFGPMPEPTIFRKHGAPHLYSQGFP